MTTPVRYKDMTREQRLAYFRDRSRAWYRKHAMAISAERSKRYHNDSEYRAMVRACSAARRLRVKSLATTVQHCKADENSLVTTP